MAKIKINPDRCKGCALCVVNCPQGLIVISEMVNSLGLKTARVKDAKQCKACTFCAIVCPDCAIEIFK